MKKLLVLLSFITFLGCKKEHLTFSGKITNPTSNTIKINKGNRYTKTIKINDDGTFSDTLIVKPGIYNLSHGNKNLKIYLKNNYKINISVDSRKPKETVVFSGIGSESSTYLAKKYLFEESAFKPNLFKLNETDFNNEVSLIDAKYKALLEEYKTMDAELYASEKNEIDNFESAIKKHYNKLTRLIKGKPSPKFENYENANGDKVSLIDFKGKYVYIDVWATWCGPCKKEIPALKKLEQEFRGKNIEFVSLSVDDGRGYNGSAEKAKEGWKKMVTEKKLNGIQIIAEKGWKSSFIKEYQVNSIPRFILIDPSGNIVNSNAQRPSNPKLKKLFKSLSI